VNTRIIITAEFHGVSVMTAVEIHILNIFSSSSHVKETVKELPLKWATTP
jgi:hypothetical protein